MRTPRQAPVANCGPLRAALRVILGTLPLAACLTLFAVLLAIWLTAGHGCREWLIRGPSPEHPYSNISCDRHLIIARISGYRSKNALVQRISRHGDRPPVSFEGRCLQMSLTSESSAQWRLAVPGLSLGRGAYEWSEDDERSGGLCLYVATPIPLLMSCLAILLAIIAVHRASLARRRSRG